MTFFKRAFLYVTRKRTKSLILFLILLIIATLTLTGLAIKDATKTAQLNVRQALGGMFTLKQNTSDPSKWKNIQNQNGSGSRFNGAPLTTDLADNIMKQVDGIIGYNATYQANALPVKKDGSKLKLIESEEEDDMSGILSSFGDVGSTVNLFASTNTLYDTYFAGGYLKLTEGRHVTSKDKNSILIGEELAKLNGIHVGDKLILQKSEYYASMNGIDPEDTKIEVEIVGLFKPTSKSTTTLPNWSMDNAFYTTRSVELTINPNHAKEDWESIVFHVDDPGQLDSIVLKVEQFSDLDPSDFIVSVDSSNVDSVMEPLSNMNKLITVLIVLILVVGAAILYLVLSNRVKERIHESGVLLSLGYSKKNIIAQYVVEILLISIVAFTLSIFASQLIAQNVGDELLDYSINSAINDTGSALGGAQNGTGMITPDSMKPQFEGSGNMAQIQVTLSQMSIISMYLVGFVIICVSVVMAALPILRLKPREILSKMS